MRTAVTIDPVFVPKTPPIETDAYGVPAAFEPVRNPTSRSHNPDNNQKRTDPFAFGSRLLEEGDDIFEFNAWDHVETDDAYKEFSELQYAKQREAPVSDFDKSRFNGNPAKWWNLFYANNKTNFFKNRKWLAQEFPIINELTMTSAPPTLLLEVGAGAGNTAFPILGLNQNPHLKIHACDFSAKAVDLIRGHENYDTKTIQADVWDVASEALPPGLEAGTVDVVLMIFIFSALAPSQWDQAIKNIYRLLKPGGQVLFRDYGRGDLAQVRFKKGRYMEENFYVRGDGTRVYFFEKEELEKIWGRKNAEPDLSSLQIKDEEKSSVQLPEKENQTPAFEVVHIGVDRRMLVNRQRKLKMYRCWMQAVFRKPGQQSQATNSDVAKVNPDH
ncbi:methyltransferase [Lophium mytilinum]|uniref:tRNA N(3)-methylcytidine methyltransferase n=1 Tax=Lophium mytilinum TaxID=390894 RepID=A0A6A6R5W7_9PEZI|nr:methyltransferase [Lophium mytilinum]